jgi:hypothetical protein
MPQLFDLPFELRELIYMALITWEHPRPQLEEATATKNYHHGIRPRWFGIGSDAVLQRPTSTCASILGATRQLNQEMTQTIDRARRRGQLVARIDCTLNGGFHQFTWLSLPLVKSKRWTTREEVVPSWIPDLAILGKLLAALHRHTLVLRATTVIEHLHIDVRLSQADLEKERRTRLQGRRVGTAIFAALTKVCDFQKQVQQPAKWQNSVTIDCLTLNVVSPARIVAPIAAANAALPETDCSREAGLQIVARELVDVWTQLWAGDEWSAQLYCQSLLECIKRVRVYIDGALVRERVLMLELERGRAERKRIAQRAGW